MSIPAETSSSGATGVPASYLSESGEELQADWVVAERESLRELVTRFRGWPALLWKRRDLVACSLRRDLQARFRGTLLGFAWVLALPLLQFAIYAFIFTQLLGVKLGATAAPGAMGVYMFTGTLVWSSFAEGIQRSTSCAQDHRHLIQKLRFPAELLPVQLCLSSLVTLLAGLLAFVGFVAVSGIWQVPSVALLKWAPLLLLLQLLFTSGLGLGLAAMQVRLRDTLPMVGVLLTVWMFVTPVFWVPSPELLPGIESWLGLVDANPMHHLLYLWRELLMSGEPSQAFEGSFARSLSLLSVWACGAFAAGSWAFFRVQRHMADEL